LAVRRRIDGAGREATTVAGDEGGRAVLLARLGFGSGVMVRAALADGVCFPAPLSRQAVQRQDAPALAVAALSGRLRR
jgi:hypothetical protein